MDFNLGELIIDGQPVSRTNISIQSNSNTEFNHELVQQFRID